MSLMHDVLYSNNPSRVLVHYAIRNQKRLEPEWENILYAISEPLWIVRYIKLCVKERIEEAENIILKCEHATFAYIRCFLKKKWPKAENLMKNSIWSEAYENTDFESDYERFQRK